MGLAFFAADRSIFEPARSPRGISEQTLRCDCAHEYKDLDGRGKQNSPCSEWPVFLQ